MSPFAFLFIAHLIGDYLFQTSWMAMNKAKHWGALITHSFVYTLIVSVVAYIGFGGLSIWAILFIFLSHVFLDRRTFVQWWVSTIMQAKGKESFWLGIIADQVFHLIVLVVALYI
ncbi:DUF3307 domain-containing protein [Bacillus sp. FJAT-45350]|uniref:DUF3307 domain-containing protein n=1 Tax=Bacillus sp. FJAT-45350 TaxID=2011014 RepID=UPI000BB757AE|nr:DUF3307 domain-containing protein [Bacillus sp. FJAT-45350]